MKICRNLTFLSRLRQISRLKVVVTFSEITTDFSIKAPKSP